MPALNVDPAIKLSLMMSFADIKTCPRCQQLFECKPGAITECACYQIHLTPHQRSVMEKKFRSCLCPGCLVQITQGIEGNLPANAYFNWSGGKDAAFALWKTVQNRDHKIKYLFTSINKVHNRVSMHGVRRELLAMQARALGIPLTTVELTEQPSMQEYEASVAEKINWLKDQGITHSIFGDIFLEDLREYRESQLKSLGIQAVFPLWKIDTTQMIREFISAGFKAIVVCVNEQYLDKSFCGRMIDESFMADLPAHVDPCGENGEYHSFVFDGPVYNAPIKIKEGEKVFREYQGPAGEKYGFWFLDLLADI